MDDLPPYFLEDEEFIRKVIEHFIDKNDEDNLRFMSQLFSILVKVNPHHLYYLIERFENLGDEFFKYCSRFF